MPNHIASALWLYNAHSRIIGHTRQNLQESRLVGFFSSVSKNWLVAMNRERHWLVSAANC